MIGWIFGIRNLSRLTQLKHDWHTSAFYLTVPAPRNKQEAWKRHGDMTLTADRFIAPAQKGTLV